METRERNGAFTISFREASLPRELRVHYPRRGEELLIGWQRRDHFLVAEEGQVCGYVALEAQVEHGVAWVGDLVVDRHWRRSGVGTMLLQAAAQWGRENDLRRLILPVQTKNYPAIQFCRALNLTLCGYSDHFWPSQDIALFFGDALR
jgi:GNAT superfamily N-acetyltransferase